MLCEILSVCSCITVYKLHYHLSHTTHYYTSIFVRFVTAVSVNILFICNGRFPILRRWVLQQWLQYRNCRCLLYLLVVTFWFSHRLDLVGCDGLFILWSCFRLHHIHEMWTIAADVPMIWCVCQSVCNALAACESCCVDRSWNQYLLIPLWHHNINTSDLVISLS